MQILTSKILGMDINPLLVIILCAAFGYARSCWMTVR